MAKTESWDTLEARLGGLRLFDASPARSERIRVRCLAVLEAQRRKKPGLRPRLEAWRKWLEPAIAFSLSALYLAAAVGSSLALLR